MPKLYNSIKIDQGLKIGLRDPDGPEWFVDMTYDRNKRTCRKLGLKYQENSNENKEEAIVAAKNFYLNFLKEKEENLSLKLPQRLTRIFTLCLLLLWVSGVAWLITEINSEQFKNTVTLKTCHPGIFKKCLFQQVRGFSFLNVKKIFLKEKKCNCIVDH